ncbi:MAG: CoA-binding protein [Saprospiraceae bacterium]
MSKKTLVLGASLKPHRYSNMAINRLVNYNHEVVAIGLREGIVADVPIVKEKPNLKDVDTITLYMNPRRQVALYDYILDLTPKRIIFNPGTENMELIKLAQAKGIKTEIACTLVMLSVGNY